MGSTRIFSFDGGGVRGVIPTILLQRLTREPGLEDLLARVEFVAGTSTGGLIALMLAADLDLQAIRELYEQRAEHVFADSLLDDIRDLGKIIGADYDVANLEREAHAVFGERTLGELSKRVLVTAFDLDNEDPEARTWKPKIFHNFEGPDSDGAQLAYKVGTYTSAAPTYFDTADGYIDGGVFAPNPAMCALAQSQDSRNLPADHAELSDVRLFSFGTGRSLTYLEGRVARLGLRAVDPPARQPHARRRRTGSPTTSAARSSATTTTSGSRRPSRPTSRSTRTTSTRSRTWWSSPSSSTSPPRRTG